MQHQPLAQAAAIPRLNGKVCMVTSSSGKRWVIPKGIIDAGMTAETTALQETWEEAGVSGELDGDAVGSYEYEKWGAVCRVSVFVMNVTEVAESWPEKEYRTREWVQPHVALQRIRERDLQAIVRDVFGMS